MKCSFFSVIAPAPGLPEGDRFPYGICGPFLDIEEAVAARDVFAASGYHSELKLLICTLVDDTYVSEDQEWARARVKRRSALNEREKYIPTEDAVRLTADVMSSIHCALSESEMKELYDSYLHAMRGLRFEKIISNKEFGDSVDKVIEAMDLRRLELANNTKSS